MIGRVALTGLAPPFRGGIAHYTLHLGAALARIADARLVAWRRQYPGILFPGRTQIDESPMGLSLPAVRVLDPLAPWTWAEAVGIVRDWGAVRLVHQWWHPWFGPATWSLLRMARARGIRVTALCHNVAPHERVPAALAVTRAALDPEAPVALHFGCVRPYKGLQDLIQAMPEVARLAPGAVLLVAGEFYDPVSQYRKQVTSLGIGASVRLEDRYVPNEDVGLMMRAADVVVLPYREATGSGVLPLARAAGVPVVATEVGDLPDAILAGKDGLLVRPRDPGALARAIAEVLSWPRRETGAPPRVEREWDSLAAACAGQRTSGG